ncbi:hypothetical protein AB5N19_06024 [Seiridium cardinale]
MYTNTITPKLNPMAQVFEPGVLWYATWMIRPAAPAANLKEDENYEASDDDNIHKPIAKYGDLYASVHCARKTSDNSFFGGGEKRQTKKHGGLSASRWGKGVN